MTVKAKAIAIPGRLAPTDLCANRGERIAVIGPNGGGKTSLLRALAGVEDALGDVTIGGRPRAIGTARARQLAFLPASRDLGWPIPVRDLVTMGVARGTADPWLDRLELRPLADRAVNRLSTGERSRVLMARVLAHRAELLLLDEPFANLEPYWVLRFLEEMEQEAERGATLLCALHDLSLLDRFDRVLLIHDGEIKVDGTAAAILESEAFTRLFRVESHSGRWRIRDHGGEAGFGGQLSVD